MRAKWCLIFKKVCQKARRFCEVASFLQYVVADGIHRLLFDYRSDTALTVLFVGYKALAFRRRLQDSSGRGCRACAGTHSRDMPHVVCGVSARPREQRPRSFVLVGVAACAAEPSDAGREREDQFSAAEDFRIDGD